MTVDNVQTDSNFNQIDDWVRASKDNVIFKYCLRKLAKKPGTTLICFILSVLVLGATIMDVCLVIVTGEKLICYRQLATAFATLLITTSAMIIWYLGMKNIYSRYFANSHIIKKHNIVHSKVD